MKMAKAFKLRLGPKKAELIDLMMNLINLNPYFRFTAFEAL